MLQKPYEKQQKHAENAAVSREELDEDLQAAKLAPRSDKNAKNGQNKIGRSPVLQIPYKKRKKRTRASAPHPGRAENGKRPEVTRLGLFVEP